jgi:lipopolysaccharide export system protein LptA
VKLIINFPLFQKANFLLSFIIMGFLLIPSMSFSAEIKITSDKFTVNEENSDAIFEGNVIITQPDLKVWAQRVIVIYGEDGPSDLKSFEAIGKVKIKQPEQTATADRGVYNPKTKILILYDNVKVINESGTITGSELIIDIASGISKFPSQSDGGRVTAIFSE